MTESNIMNCDKSILTLLLSHNVKMDNRDCARLIDYYRIKIGILKIKDIIILESFDKERTEMLEKLEGLRISQEDFQKTQWNLKKRSDDIYDLQKALTETNDILNYERRQVINLTSELESYKCILNNDIYFDKNNISSN